MRGDDDLGAALVVVAAAAWRNGLDKEGGLCDLAAPLTCLVRCVFMPFNHNSSSNWLVDPLLGLACRLGLVSREFFFCAVAECRTRVPPAVPTGFWNASREAGIGPG